MVTQLKAIQEPLVACNQRLLTRDLPLPLLLLTFWNIPSPHRSIRRIRLSLVHHSLCLHRMYLKILSASSLTGNIDPFESDSVPNFGDFAFDPFGSYVGHPDSSQSSSNGSFDPFGDSSGKASGTFQAVDNCNTFSAYPYSNPSNPFNSTQSNPNCR